MDDAAETTSLAGIEEMLSSLRDVSSDSSCSSAGNCDDVHGVLRSASKILATTKKTTTKTANDASGGAAASSGRAILSQALSYRIKQAAASERSETQRQDGIIASLRAEVESLRKSNSDLRKRADDLRDENIGMAKRLARARGGGQLQKDEHEDAKSYSSNNSRSRSEKPVRGGIDAYGNRITDLRSANDELERLVHAKDEEIDNLLETRRVGDELISILRRQVSSLREERAGCRRGEDDPERCTQAPEGCSERLRTELAKSEMKNAALKRSLRHCMEEIDLVKSRLDEMQLAQEPQPPSSAEESRSIDKDEERDDRLEKSERTIFDLREELNRAREDLKRARNFRSAAASAMALELAEVKRASERDAANLVRRARESERRVAELEEENAALRSRREACSTKVAPPPECAPSSKNKATTAAQRPPVQQQQRAEQSLLLLLQNFRTQQNSLAPLAPAAEKPQTDGKTWSKPR